MKLVIRKAFDGAASQNAGTNVGRRKPGGGSGEGSRGGHITGHTKSGEPIYEGHASGGGDATSAGRAPRLSEQIASGKEPMAPGDRGEEVDHEQEHARLKAQHAKMRAQYEQAQRELEAHESKMKAKSAPSTAVGRTGKPAKNADAGKPFEENAGLHEAGDAKDSAKEAARLLSSNGSAGKTKSGKEIKVGSSTEGWSRDDLHEAAQAHRAAQMHLLSAAQSAGDGERTRMKALAKKHLDAEFEATSGFVSSSAKDADEESVWKSLTMAEFVPVAQWRLFPSERGAAMLKSMTYSPKLVLSNPNATSRLEKASQLGLFGDGGGKKGGGAKTGEGSRGGHVIGHTKSGKPIYESAHESHASFTSDDHRDAAMAHEKLAGDHHEQVIRHASDAASHRAGMDSSGPEEKAAREANARHYEAEHAKHAEKRDGHMNQATWHSAHGRQKFRAEAVARAHEHTARADAHSDATINDDSPSAHMKARDFQRQAASSHRIAASNLTAEGDHRAATAHRAAAISADKAAEHHDRKSKTIEQVRGKGGLVELHHRDGKVVGAVGQEPRKYVGASIEDARAAVKRGTDPRDQIKKLGEKAKADTSYASAKANADAASAAFDAGRRSPRTKSAAYAAAQIAHTAHAEAAKAAHAEGKHDEARQHEGKARAFLPDDIGEARKMMAGGYASKSKKSKKATSTHAAKTAEAMEAKEGASEYESYHRDADAAAAMTRKAKATGSSADHAAARDAHASLLKRATKLEEEHPGVNAQKHALAHAFHEDQAKPPTVRANEATDAARTAGTHEAHGEAAHLHEKAAAHMREQPGGAAHAAGHERRATMHRDIQMSLRAGTITPEVAREHQDARMRKSGVDLLDDLIKTMEKSNMKTKTETLQHKGKGKKAKAKSGKAGKMASSPNAPSPGKTEHLNPMNVQGALTKSFVEFTNGRIENMDSRFAGMPRGGAPVATQVYLGNLPERTMQAAAPRVMEKSLATDHAKLAVDHALRNAYKNAVVQANAGSPVADMLTKSMMPSLNALGVNVIEPDSLRVVKSAANTLRGLADIDVDARNGLEALGVSEAMLMERLVQMNLTPAHAVML